jgi:hypothetical protein
MGQVCEGDREILDLEQREASMQVSNSKPITLAAPAEEDKKLMAAPVPPQEEAGPKSKAVLLDGGLSIS